MRYDEHEEDERWETVDRHGNAYRGRRMWSKPFRDLIDLPSVLPVLQELLGEPKWGHAHPALPEELRRRIRLDHDNIHYQGPVAEGDKPARGNHLHGGPAAHHITAVFELKSVGRGDGGFGCCPGTHMPAGLAKAEGMGVENWKTEWCDTVRLPHRPQAHGHTKLDSPRRWGSALERQESGVERRRAGAPRRGAGRRLRAVHREAQPRHGPLDRLGRAADPLLCAHEPPPSHHVQPRPFGT